MNHKLKTLIEAKDLHKDYLEDSGLLSILRGIDFEVATDEKVGIVGASGVGKSTLIHILGGLDHPTKGSIWVEGENLYQMKEPKRAALRNQRFGFVFQFYHLLPELTALENVALPTWIASFSKEEGREVAREALKRVGLSERENHLPSKLSGGEQQRVALARACVLKPKVIFADEPTGNLDEATGNIVFEYLLSIVEETKGALVLVTHNRDLTKKMDRVWELKNGSLHQI